MGLGGMRWGNTRICPRFKKKNLISVPKPFIKFKLRPIKGEAGRIPKKTLPIVISTCDLLFIVFSLPMNWCT